MSGKEKRPLVPRLRFPEFREAAEWGKDKLEELITTVSQPSKLQSSSYRPQGKFPIIDQSQELICGWTDDESAVIAESLPLIVFGDHTCVLKFVEKPFAQGADGIKILKAKPAISAEYLGCVCYFILAAFLSEDKLFSLFLSHCRLVNQEF